MRPSGWVAPAVAKPEMVMVGEPARVAVGDAGVEAERDGVEAGVEIVEGLQEVVGAEHHVIHHGRGESTLVYATEKLCMWLGATWKNSLNGALESTYGLSGCRCRRSSGR